MVQLLSKAVVAIQQEALVLLVILRGAMDVRILSIIIGTIGIFVGLGMSDYECCGSR